MNYEWVWSSTFVEKTFADGPKTTTFAKVFSLKSFPQYGTTCINSQVLLSKTPDYSKPIGAFSLLLRRLAHLEVQLARSKQLFSIDIY